METGERLMQFGWPGDGGLGLRLIAAIRAGRKTATCCPVASCTDSELAATRSTRGSVVWVVDRFDVRHFRVRVVDVFETTWGDPDPRVVRGEGFETADAWRAAMSAAWRDLVAAGAFELRDDTRMLVELFEVVEGATSP